MRNLARTRRPTVELRIPALPEFVMVAKRTAGGLGAGVGFSLEGIDDLNIAVAQACERAIHAADRLWGPGQATLKINFHLAAGGLEVDVQVQPGREAEARREADEQVARRRAQAEAVRAEQASLDVEAVAVDMIRAFVDELRCNVDPRGGVRMRMVKYVVH